MVKLATASLALFKSDFTVSEIVKINVNWNCTMEILIVNNFGKFNWIIIRHVHRSKSPLNDRLSSTMYIKLLSISDVVCI